MINYKQAGECAQNCFTCHLNEPSQKHPTNLCRSKFISKQDTIAVVKKSDRLWSIAKGNDLTWLQQLQDSHCKHTKWQDLDASRA